MPRISLRAYEKQLDELIEQNQLDMVIDHCRHILQSYPKCISTYRILGKSFLEGKQYPESADIFERVLTVFPDDFISHVGMSVIKESENNLDAAIWHMELAFDSQPSNITIQEELKRLFGRRDGTHPAKIRLTRGALVRMYVKGELYPQAITEIKSALAEDPKRIDLQVLLAKMYYLLGDASESLNLCTQLISSFPYSYELNKIMVALLPASDKAEKLQIYLDRLKALNPYEAFVGEKYPLESDVPDDLVELDQLEAISSAPSHDWVKEIDNRWNEPSIEESTNFFSASDSLLTNKTTPAFSGFEGESLNAPVVSEESSLGNTVENASLSETESEDQIPSWMQEAGWLPSTEEKVNETGKAYKAMEDETIAPQPSEDIPDWLRSIAPESPDEPAPTQPSSSTFANPTADSPFTAEPVNSTSSADELPDWLKSFEIEKEDNSEGTAIPEWMKNDSEKEESQSVSEQIPAAPDSNVPDWMNFSTSDKSSSILNSDKEPVQNPDIPEWLRSLDQNESDEKQNDLSASSTDKSNVSNWMNTFADNETEEQISKKETTPDINSDLSQASSEEDSNVLDWMKSFEQEEPVKKQDEESVVDHSNSINPNQFTRSLEPNDMFSGEKENTLLPKSPSLPEDWKDSLVEVNETEEENKSLKESPRDQDSGIPEWVRAVIEKGPLKEEQTESNETEPQVSPSSEDNSVPVEEAALSEESSEDLLSWLRDLKPEETSAPDEPVNAESLNESFASNEAGYDLSSQIDRLNNLTKKETSELDASVLDSEQEVKISAEISDETSPQVVETNYNNAPISIDQLGSYSASVADTEEPVELSSSPDTINPPPSISEEETQVQNSVIDTTAEEINHLSLMAQSDPDNYLPWQQLGDAYARINDFVNALQSYNKAEEIILNHNK
jgi:tetratricopeptide (TPR) repeat protein